MSFDFLRDLDGNNRPINFRENSGLAILLPQQEESLSSPLPCISPLPPLSLNGDPETEPDFHVNNQQDDFSIRPLPSPIPPITKSSGECVAANDVLRYLNLSLPHESDTETISKISAASSCGDISVTMHTPNPYLERRPAGLPDVYSRPGELTGYDRQPKQRKRKETEMQGPNVKRRKGTQPSKFCHICVKSIEQGPMVPCANVVNATCRKAICQKCFLKHGYLQEWEHASVNHAILAKFHAGELHRLPEGAWTCLHCRSMCPPSAQCKIYSKTNRKRHLMLKQRKLEKERHMEQRELLQKAPQPISQTIPEYLNVSSSAQCLDACSSMHFSISPSPTMRTTLPSIRDMESVGLDLEIPKREEM